MTGDKLKQNARLQTRLCSSLVTRHLSPLLIFRRRALIVRDPGDEEAEPVLRGFEDGDADARRAVDGGGDAHDARGDFDGRAVRAVRAQVELFAARHFLVEVEERAGGGNVVRLGRLAPRRAVLRATGDDDGQTQRHAQRETSLFIGRRRHKSSSQLLAISSQPAEDRNKNGVGKF